MGPGFGHTVGVPELVEVEIYRQVAERALHRVVHSVDAHDSWFLKHGTTAEDLGHSLIGNVFTGALRRGKLLTLAIGGAGDAATLGLRFGMTGRLVVDNTSAIEELLYSSHRSDPGYVRFAVGFSDGGSLAISDPRRLGGVELNPVLEVLGPDAATITRRELQDVLGASDAPLKARLMDQSQIAGVGNLIADEVLWRAGLDPLRAAGSLSAAQVTRLASTVVSTIVDLQTRGGSHLGDLMPARARDGRCPKCGRPLLRRTIGGRTTYSCPRHQPAS